MSIKLEAVTHPLEPLTALELEHTIAILRKEKELDEHYRFASVNLYEPPKAQVLQYKQGDVLEREAFCILLNNRDGQTYEAVVSVTGGHIVSWEHIPGVQPSIMADEFMECQNVVKTNPDMIAALERRGLTDMDKIMVDPWSAGHFGHEEEEGRRIVRALSYYRTSEFDNLYARPISGLYALVDLNHMEVMKVVDREIVPLPPLDGNYTADAVGPLRSDIRPLDIIQPQGPSFTVQGHEIDWQKWKVRFGFTSREGLVLHTVSYNDQGRERPILYRASLSEMVVPYGDPTEPVNRNNAFDAGEYGIGMLANPLELGCDCLGEIQYFDAHFSDSQGNIIQINNAICLHEEDFGIGWKHTDWRTGHVEVRRSRRLVLSSISTVGNYEYGFFWYFYQDGSIQFEVKLTGILHTEAIQPDTRYPYGNLIAPQLFAAHHQHFFNVRMDLMIDGINNSVCEVNTVSMEKGPDNPYSNGFYPVTTTFRKESEAIRDLDLRTARYWKFINPNAKNALGDPVGYKLFAGENAYPYAHDDSPLMKRAGFLKHHLYVTPFDPDERYASGSYPNQHAGGDGLEHWAAADREIENTDVVVWYNMGHHHITRPEDWPVMPTAYISFMLKPTGFFDRSPALDVPPSPSKAHGHCQHHHG
ncbi:primary-amine oxidase [Paenibacillus kandeliae]|uniref:primary-amine oxidase n=1 Tax=Paenibacillus kandeliae TaxID=3231269 RepID=UPI003457C266